ncbi:MAG: hypothetical protein HFG02_07350 [Oscillibacter sp.]|nr:hypothetical protein [Oscillibacter sp.]
MAEKDAGQAARRLLFPDVSEKTEFVSAAVIDKSSKSGYSFYARKTTRERGDTF